MLIETLLLGGGQTMTAAVEARCRGRRLAGWGECGRGWRSCEIGRRLGKGEGGSSAEGKGGDTNTGGEWVHFHGHGDYLGDDLIWFSCSGSRRESAGSKPNDSAGPP